MRIFALLLGSILLIAAGFPADKYEVTARFTSALVSKNFKQASSMLISGAKISEWGEGSKPLASLATYIARCPIKSIEGNELMNINVLLDCDDGYHGMSVEFDGRKIKEVNFGPPPAIRVNTPGETPNG